MITTVTDESLDQFIRTREVVVIHFDAAWDGYRSGVRLKMNAATEQFESQVSFGEIDTDEQPGACRFVSLNNVPTIAYFRHGELVAALVGASQNIAARTARVLTGEPIGYNDGTGDLLLKPARIESPALSTHTCKSWWKFW